MLWMDLLYCIVRTFFMFSARRSYSSRTSCSRGERSSLGAEADADVESVDSMIKEVERNNSPLDMALWLWQVWRGCWVEFGLLRGWLWEV